MEAVRLGERFRKKKVLKRFCLSQAISLSSYYRYARSYKHGGIEALVPLRGRRKIRLNKGKGSIEAVIEIDLKDPLQGLASLSDIIEVPGRDYEERSPSPVKACRPGGPSILRPRSGRHPRRVSEVRRGFEVRPRAHFAGSCAG